MKAIIFAAAVLALLAVASGQCIECKDCRGSNACLSKCQRECPKPPVTVSVTQCKSYGENAGREAAKFACDLTLKYCGANKIEPRGFLRPPRVTLQQCGNAAFGVCQAHVRDRNKSPCGRNFGGVSACNSKEFKEFYESIADGECNQKVAVFDKPQG